jgi:hypothetical protein
MPALASTVNLGFFFPRMFGVLKWGLMFSDTRALTTTAGRSLWTGSEIGHSLTECARARTHAHRVPD